MRLADHEREIALMLTKAGVDSPGLCARFLVSAASGLTGYRYLLQRQENLPEEKIELLGNLARRRAAGEPMAYILGKKGFYEHDFFVDKSTLIPRPETEMLVELALTRFGHQKITFIDIGCGCGCIGLSLLAKRPDWFGILVDNNSQALKMTKINALQLAPQASILLADLFDLPFGNGMVDLIVANPPYIGLSEKKDVMTETLAWEPHYALFSPKDGLAHLYALIEKAYNLLRSGGWLMVEHGWTQGTHVMKAMKTAGFDEYLDFQDLAGLDRCAICKKK